MKCSQNGEKGANFGCYGFFLIYDVGKALHKANFGAK